MTLSGAQRSEKRCNLQRNQCTPVAAASPDFSGWHAPRVIGGENLPRTHMTSKAEHLSGWQKTPLTGDMPLGWRPLVCDCRERYRLTGSYISLLKAGRGGVQDWHP